MIPVLAQLALAMLVPLPDRPTQGTTTAPLPDSPHCVRVLEPKAGRIQSVALSPDGTRVLVGCETGHAFVYDRTSGERIEDLFVDAGMAWDVEFDPTGARLLVVQPTKTHVWNAKTFALERTLSGQKLGMMFACFSADGRRIATGSTGNPVHPAEESEACVWDLEAVAPIAIVPGMGYRVRPRFRSDGSMLLLCCESSNDMSLLNLDEQRAVRTFAAPKGPLADAAWSPDGNTIVSVGASGFVAMFDVKTGKLVRELQGHAGHMLACSFSRDGNDVSTTSWVDRTTRIWNAKSGKARFVLAGHEERVTQARFAPNGGSFASADAAGHAIIFELTKGKVAARLDGHTDLISGLAFTADSKFIVTGSFDGTARVWRNACVK